MHSAAVYLIEQAKSQSDRELVDEYLLTKSEESFAELVKRHSKMVRRVAADLTPDVADDITQATFALFQRKIASVSGRESAAGWLCLTARRLAMKARSSTARRLVRESKSTNRIQVEDPADELSLREVRSIVVQEMNALPDPLRIPLLVCYWDGDTHQEAARRLGCSLSTLKRRLETAREKLAVRLKRKGFGPSVLFTTLSVMAATSARSHAVTVAKVLSPFARQLLQSPAWISVAGPLAATVMIIASGAGLSLSVSAKGEPPTESAVAQTSKVSKPTERIVNDSLGDPLPPGAVARFGTARLRPEMQTTALTFDPTGQSLFSYSHSYQNASRFSVWNVGTGKELQRIEVPEIGLKTFRWTPNGQGLAVVQTGRDEHWLWNLTDKQSTAPKLKDKLNTAWVDTGEIITVAISPDGKRVAAGRYNGSWMRAIVAPANPPATVSFSVWEAETSRPLQSQTPRWTHERKDDCIGLTFTPDGRELVGVFLENMPRTTTVAQKPDALANVIRWDASTGNVLGSFTIPNPMRKPHNATRHTFNRQLPIGISPKDNAIAIGADDGIVHFWSPKDGRELKSIVYDKKGAIETLEFNADGTQLAAVVCDGDWYTVENNRSSARSIMWSRFEVRNVATGDLIQKWDERGGTYASGLSPDAKMVAKFGLRDEIEIYETNSSKRLLSQLSQLNESMTISLNQDGTRAMTAGSDGRFQTWDVNNGRLVSTSPLPKTKAEYSIKQISPDLKNAYVIVNRTVTRIDIPSGRETALTDKDPTPLHFSILGMNADGVLAVSKSNLIEGGTVRFIDRDNRTIGPEIKLPVREKEVGNPHIAIWSPDGTQIILGGNFSFEWNEPGNKNPAQKMFMLSRGWLAIYDAKTGKQLKLWEGKTFYPDRIHPMNDSKSILVVGHVDDDFIEGKLPMRKHGTRNNAESIQVFDLETLQPIRRFSVAPGFNPTASRGVGTSTVSDDGKMLAVVGPLNDILIYEIATGRIRKRISGHNGGNIGLLKFDPTGRRLISTGTDRTALVWDVTIPEGVVPTTLESAWQDLSSFDSAKAFAAERYFLDHPAEAVTHFKSALKPAVSPKAADVKAWIAALDSDDFKERENASDQLFENVDQLRSELEEASKQNVSLEVKNRLAKIMETNEGSRPLEGTRLLQTRAVEVLERLETPDAVALLKTLASGAAKSTLTRDAKLAVARVEAKTKPSR